MMNSSEIKYEDFKSDEEKRDFLQEYNDEDRTLRNAPESDVELYRRLVEEGIEKGWTEAMVAKAYSCYGGDEAYACDWFMCRDLLLQLISIQGDENPFHYSTLGYIYYYGRCNDGKPDYDTAFKYFSVGAANGVFESQYKLADMYITGQGIFKSEKAAARIIGDIYAENYDNFCKEIYACKFADIAFRTGNLYENGIGVEKSLEEAFHYYLQAQYAIRLRVARHDYYGDKTVERNIEEAVARVREALPDAFIAYQLELEHPGVFAMLMEGAAGLDITLERVGNDYYLHAKRFAPAEDCAQKVLFSIGEANYCELTDTATLHVVGLTNLKGNDGRMFITSIQYNEEQDLWEFGRSDQVLLSFSCRCFRFENYGVIDQ